MKAMVVGDIHGCWALLNGLIKEQKPELVLSVGDFGFWPGNKWYDPKKCRPGNAKVHWCDGNHEHFHKLAKRKSDEVFPGVFYQPRGSSLTLPDGRVVFFCGGADSIDKNRRTMGFDWFPEEVSNYAEGMKIIRDAEKLGRADIVISHTCPTEFPMKHECWGKESDPTRKLLSEVLEILRPGLWYFGHWHEYREGDSKGCHWIALDRFARPGCWEWLK